jgi:D-beta-D-heptose 7-phosphate kinase/D-beta-D-heptose 1-phosphate adenosyltransferase
VEAKAVSIELALRLHRLPKPRLLVVGDSMVDYDLHGQCARFAAEAAGVPVFRAERSEWRFGGAGAVAEMARALGASVTLLTGSSVSTKARHYVDGRLMFRADRDALPLERTEENRILVEIVGAMPKMAAVLIADYGKATCTDAVLRTAIEAAKEYGVPCIVDPARGKLWDMYRGVTAIKCNRDEFDTLCRLRFDGKIVLTTGAYGMTLIPGWDRFPARLRDAVDTTGAGDMVLAALGLCIACGVDWPDACQIANAAAGCKVERHGAVPVSRAEVVADLLHGQKVIPAELLPAVADAARAQNRSVVFTNGAFDVLHSGHVHCLTEARKQGDLLIVAVNSDMSVRRLKGDKRPINPLAGRCAVLAAMACVDYVVAFDADTPERLAAAVKPDCMVKGDSYRPEQIAGAEHAQRVHLVPLKPGCSSTATLARMEPARPPVVA